MAEMYKISGERMKDIADQTRRLSDVGTDLTPAQIVETLAGVRSSAEIPIAEEASFGSEEDWTEYGIKTPTTYNASFRSSSYAFSIGYEFQPNETFAVVGLRIFINQANHYLQLWDCETKTKLAEVDVSDSNTPNTWVEAKLTVPINVEKGKKYIVCCYTPTNYTTDKVIYLDTSYVTFNSKITMTKCGSVRTGNQNVFPDGFPDTKYRHSVDIIMGAALTETVVTEYRIQIATLTGIADEVKRITGETGTLSTAQIVTALQGIETPTGT